MSPPFELFSRILAGLRTRLAMNRTPRRGVPASWAVALLWTAAAAIGAPAPSPRERLLFDGGWRFHRGNAWGTGYRLDKAGGGEGPANMDFSDASWRRIDLPHDWAVELPFDPGADGGHGFKPVGPDYPENSIGWYRKTFDLPAADAGKRLWLEFDGVYRDATVFVNGWFVGRHPSGYDSFRCDVTDVVNPGGRNVVAVRVDASEFEGWFYEGAGIYRHVWLVKTAPLAVAPDGVFVHGDFPGNDPFGRSGQRLPARLGLQVELLNTLGSSREAAVDWQVLGPEGRAVAGARQSGSVAAANTAVLSAEASVAEPELWSPETPRLYTLVTTVSSGGAVVDRVETPFGIRTFGFDPDRGFLLNGRPYELKGTCNHQDHAGVGTALPDRLQYFRIARLKAMGSNAYRTAHGAPTPELLDACDRLGMLVMDENRLLGSDAENMSEWRGQIRRDRNHASVALWSLANEEFAVQTTPAGARVAASMQDLVRRLDPTRPVTYNAPLGDVFEGIDSVIEVRGWSYHVGEGMDAYHREHPRQPNVGSEQGSTVGTRGIYANDPVRGYVSAYDDNKTDWSQTAEEWWSFFAARPWLSGGFVWTGFDYRGEPTPYGWPCINSHFGILDTCGFPKDNFWYYKAWWTDSPVLHLLPHWNWPGKEGRPIDVRALSNCDEVELFLNGRSLGRKAMKPNGSLSWKVPYAPGTLAARGFKGGRQVAEATVETTGAPAAVGLRPDRAAIAADGRDLAVVTVEIVDAKGRIVPVADNVVSFGVSGPGRIIGVGNGNPSCHEPDVVVPEFPSRSCSLEGWRWTRVADAYREDLPELKPGYDDSGWSPCDVSARRGTLAVGESGIFRCRFTAAPRDLAQRAVELQFGRIAGDARVFLNGERIGTPNDPSAPCIYDIKDRLRAGQNLVAVELKTWGSAGGVCDGAALAIQGFPSQLHWSRSAFNGLAEVLVQSTGRPGAIALTATSPGLKPVVIQIQTQPTP